MTIVYLLIMVAALVNIALIGWFLIVPPIEWVCDKIFALAVKGNEYYILTRQLKDGQVQDQTT